METAFVGLLTHPPYIAMMLSMHSLPVLPVASLENITLMMFQVHVMGASEDSPTLPILLVRTISFPKAKFHSSELHP